MPNFDPNAVNQIKANFLNPSTMQLGKSGGGGGGFDPDQYNSLSFSFFNPSAMMAGKRRALGTYLHIVHRSNLQKHTLRNTVFMGKHFGSNIHGKFQFKLIYILFVVIATGVVPLCSPKKAARTSSIVQCIF